LLLTVAAAVAAAAARLIEPSSHIKSLWERYHSAALAPYMTGAEMRLMLKHQIVAMRSRVPALLNDLFAHYGAPASKVQASIKTFEQRLDAFNIKDAANSLLEFMAYGGASADGRVLREDFINKYHKGVKRVLSPCFVL
jgi:hypothetical protein